MGAVNEVASAVDNAVSSVGNAISNIAVDDITNTAIGSWEIFEGVSFVIGGPALSIGICFPAAAAGGPPGWIGGFPACTALGVGMVGMGAAEIYTGFHHINEIDLSDNCDKKSKPRSSNIANQH